MVSLRCGLPNMAKAHGQDGVSLNLPWRPKWEWSFKEAKALRNQRDFSLLEDFSPETDFRNY